MVQMRISNNEMALQPIVMGKMLFIAAFLLFALSANSQTFADTSKIAVFDPVKTYNITGSTLKSYVIGTGSTNITTLGTITTGTWNATAVAAGFGGTGQTTYTIGDILQASASTTLSKLNSVATGNALISGGVATVSSWGKIGLTTHVSGILPGANGGTGNGFFAISGPASTLKTFTLPNSSSNILTDNAAVTIAQGGTGTQSTLTGLLLGSASAFTAITSTTVGQIPRCTGTNTFAFGALDLADADAVTGTLPFGNGGQDIVHGRATGQTAAVATVATLTVGGADATYTVSGNLLITTSGGTEAIALKVAYTDEGNTARDHEIPLLRIGTNAWLAATAGALGALPYPSTQLQIRCKASTSITIKTTGTFTGTTYNVEGLIERKK